MVNNAIEICCNILSDSIFETNMNITEWYSLIGVSELWMIPSKTKEPYNFKQIITFSDVDDLKWIKT